MAQITLQNKTLYAAGSSGASNVVGYESKRTRVVRYTLLTDAAGASRVTLTFVTGGLGGGTWRELRFFIGTDPNSHKNAVGDVEYSGTLTRDGNTFTGSVDMLLLPTTSYYVWVFPATTNYCWVKWGSSAAATTEGGAKSVMSLSGTKALGSELTFQITRYTSSITHKLTYACGTASGTVGSNIGTSAKWTPPLTLASQNKTGASVSITFTLASILDGVEIGSNTYTHTFSIPESVRPACSLAVEDPTGILDEYGYYVKGLSKFQITVTPETAYGASITKYAVSANGVSYSKASVTTGLLASSGPQKITATVTDSRARTSTAEATVEVRDYAAPVISALSVGRCDADGTDNDRGECIKIHYSYTATSLDGQNPVTAKVQYKQTGDSSYTSAVLSYEYAVSDGTAILAATSDSSYDIQIVVTDGIKTTKRATSVSTGYTTMDFRAGGRGVAFGKVAEDDVLDVAMDAKFRSGLQVADAKGILRDLGLLMYPVGSVFISTVETSPADTIGGTWERLKDRFLLAAGDTYAAGKTGGAATHTLTANEMPKHTHGPGTMNITGSFELRHAFNGDMVYGHKDGAFTATPNGGTQTWGNGVSVASKSAKIDKVAFSAKDAWTGVTAETGGGKAHSIMPPYMTVYMWKRTA